MNFAEQRAQPRDRRLALATASGMVVFGIAVMMLGRMQGPVLPAFLPALTGSVVVTELLSAAILLGHFWESRRLQLAFAGAGYLVSGILAVPYLLTFPGVFSLGGWFGANAQTAVTLWAFWHVVFAICVLASAVCVHRQLGENLSPEATNRVGYAVVAACATVSVLAAFVSLRAPVPAIVVNGTFTSFAHDIVLPTIVVLDLAALAAIAFSGALQSVAHCWLGLAVLASMMDSLLGLTAPRFSYVWYGGKLFLFVSSTLIVAMFVYETMVVHRRLARANAELADVAHLRSLFVATVSHEIRTPMNAIIGVSDLLREHDFGPDENEQIRMIGDAGRGLLRIVNDILDFSKIEAGKLEIEARSFMLRRAVQDVASILGMQAESKGLTLTVDVSSEMPDYIMGDDGRLRQVLLNLVGNALKFTERGGIVVRVEPEHGATPRRLMRFTVEDTGIGIAPDKLAALFAPYVQASAATSRTHGGTGLGLSISKGIVELLGGEMGVRSTLGCGSAFWFTMPLVRAERPPEGASAPLRSGLHVLVADDNAVNQKVMLAMLKRLGVTADAVSTGSAAVRAVRGCRYDAVLMDHQMPDLDGLHATLLVRGDADARIAALPIIIVTADTQRRTRTELIEAGADDVITKPVRLEELAAMLAQRLPVTV